MLRPLARMLAAALAASIAPACTQDNPLFAPIGGDDATTATSASPTTTAGLTTVDLTTADPGSGEDSSTLPTTGDVDPGTTSATSTTAPIGTTGPLDTSTGEPLPDTSTGQGESGEPPAEPVTVIASLATCVLLAGNGFGYLGPLGCEQLTEMSDSSNEIGVMILDQSYVPAGGRESRVYIRFEVPVAPVGKVLTSATLSVNVSGSADAGGPWSGDLYLSDAFDGNGLNVFAPGGFLLTTDPGPSFPDQASSWQIPVDKVVPNQPLYLGIGALDTEAVFFRSSRASDEKRPRLQLIYE